MLDQTDAAYIAGLIDGEGTVTLSRRHLNENRQLVVSISITDRPLLEYVLNSVGAGKITNKKTYKAKCSEIILRDHIRLIPRNGHYSPEIKQARTDFEHTVAGLTIGQTNTFSPWLLPDESSEDRLDPMLSNG